MPDDQDHYRRLGVRRDCTPAEIRAAYIALVKSHHPDRAGGEDRKVAELNRAYWTLKDPKRRSEYDASLDSFGPSLPDASGAPIRLRPSAGPGHGRSRNADRAIGALLVAGALASVIWISGRLPEPTSRSEMPEFMDADAGATAPSTRVSAANVRSAVRSLFSSALRENGAQLEARSAACFARAEQARSLISTDHCIGFDLALGYWNGEAGTLGEAAGMRPAVRRPRHLAALDRIHGDRSDNEERWTQVERIAFREILQIVDPAASSDSGSVQPSQIR